TRCEITVKTIGKITRECDQRRKHKKPKVKSMEATTSPTHLLQHCSGSDELGRSMRVYSAATGKVPFGWEDEPGKPKSPPREGALPPLCPSPAMQSARLTDKDRGRRQSLKRRADQGGFEGCLPVKFQLGRAM
uniref:Uncharacterized protein n=2 Tax=Aegilops tauschii TaxID=37682 RepID=A0A453PUX6_AEGTS